MTILCAYTDGTTTWLGSDTRQVARIGDSVHGMDSGVSKWVIDDGWAVGICGDVYAADLVEAGFLELISGLDFDATQDSPADKAAPWAFTQRLAALWEAGGIKRVYRDDAVGSWQNSGILACAGAIWDIDGAMAVIPVPRGAVFCRGSAKAWAQAAAWGYQRADAEATPARLIDVALDAAAQFDCQIAGRAVHILSA